MHEGSENLVWRKSSRCGTSACVEIAADTNAVYLRNSQDPAARRLVFSHGEWASFIASVKAGDFDELPK